MLIGSKGLVRISWLLLAVAGVALSSGAAAQEVIRIGGTGLGTLLIQRLGVTYAKLNPSVQIKPVLPPMGSNGSLRALASGSIQIAVVTFPSLPVEQRKDADTNTVTPWVRTPLVFTGHDIVSGTKLTLAQVGDIYSGRMTEWPDGKQIRLITRTERESDTRLLRAISPLMDEAVATSIGRTGMPFAENDLDNQQMLEHTAGSFGAIGLGQLLLMDSPLKPINLDGILPTMEGLQSGAYRIEKPLYLVTNKNLSTASQKFIRYLQSADVVKKIRRYGFITKQRD